MKQIIIRATGVLGHAAKNYTRLVSGLESLAAVIVFILMLLINGDVIGRFVFSRPVPGTFEIAISLLVFLVFFGFANTQYLKRNVRITMLTERLSPRVRPVFDLIAHFIGVMIFGLITYEATRYAIHALRINETGVALVSIPTWPSRFAVALGTCLLAIQFVIDMCVDLKRLIQREVTS